MFAVDEIDEWAAANDVGPNPSDLKVNWLRYLEVTLDEATIRKPDAEWMASGGKQGTHTEHLGYILAEMQHLPRTHAGASW